MRALARENWDGLSRNCHGAALRGRPSAAAGVLRPLVGIGFPTASAPADRRQQNPGPERWELRVFSGGIRPGGNVMSMEDRISTSRVPLLEGPHRWPSEQFGEHCHQLLDLDFVGAVLCAADALG
jgi:hypothetical protein